ncbi:hypothetical protein XAP412_460023 [Xanthomonas phaseoli pv. phaseoli]|uniref:Uncharacterized protein n=1 Tax=Xanthomonas campestris pv. phaseoli TaxID=317013 RepID=A0AB38E3M7_XANCH|nr:hypothetical protein XAP6984_510022 [Xanthomonas phaseoli pv. phaseoli]SON86037.1 hypothetical protein XAP412_460023 [Xanthomonas phaseoli pv. phaseoli]SON90453.1 hypothetical protein XAP7430_480023 [Xanthomonas phaseoli pv. phaseoli]
MARAPPGGSGQRARSRPVRVAPARFRAPARTRLAVRANGLPIGLDYPGGAREAQAGAVAWGGLSTNP